MTRCKECIFRNRKGNEKPCIDCDEIAIKTRHTKNYFLSIYNVTNVDDTVMKSLENRLHTLTNENAELLNKFTVTEDTVLLTSFEIKDNEDIMLYQLSSNSNIDDKQIVLNKDLLQQFYNFYYKKK